MVVSPGQAHPTGACTLLYHILRDKVVSIGRGSGQTWPSPAVGRDADTEARRHRRAGALGRAREPDGPGECEPLEARARTSLPGPSLREPPGHTPSFRFWGPVSVSGKFLCCRAPSPGSGAWACPNAPQISPSTTELTPRLSPSLAGITVPLHSSPIPPRPPTNCSRAGSSWATPSCKVPPKPRVCEGVGLLALKPTRPGRRLAGPGAGAARPGRGRSSSSPGCAWSRPLPPGARPS